MGVRPAERGQVSGPGTGERRRRPEGSVRARLARAGGLRPLHSPGLPADAAARWEGEGGVEAARSGLLRVGGAGASGRCLRAPPAPPRQPQRPGQRRAHSAPSSGLGPGARRRGPAPPGPQLRGTRRAGPPRSPLRGAFPSPRRPRF